MAIQLHTEVLSQNVAVGLLKSFRIRQNRAGFTLVELLIVIAIIGILTAMLLPALARSKSRAQAILCMNNSRQLAMAWTMYSGENNERLVYNLGGDANRTSVAPTTEPNWVSNIMDWNLSPDNTNTAFATASTSLLSPFAGSSTTIYRCPADRVLSDRQKQAGWSARVRSVSMNAMMGNPGSLLQGGTNVNNPGYRQFLKENEISRPASIFVFLDEHPDSINDGYFLNRIDADYAELEWRDLPASYHNGGGSFSFADGHVDIHAWLFETTRRPSVPDGAPLPIPIRTGEEADFYWVFSKMSTRP